jgi:hypothetical protein
VGEVVACSNKILLVPIHELNGKADPSFASRKYRRSEADRERPTYCIIVEILFTLLDVMLQ